MTETAQPLRVAYMGPPRSFSHAAALKLYGASASHVVTRTIPDAIEAVRDGAADVAVVPIENSIEGGVNATLDALFETDLTICHEFALDIELCLLAQSSDLSRIRRVTSHPQPLGQCKQWLRAHLPGAEIIVASSTTAAAQDALSDPETAAVGSRMAAEIGLVVVRAGIEDHAGNVTRFLVVGREAMARTGADKTSLVFSTPHERGALRRVLEIFDAEGLNLTRIESRPLRGQLWQYVFFTDLEGHRDDPEVARALAQLAQTGAMVRVLGSYPRAALKSA
jgi:chorismate mutase/prephenate dehydratase